MKRLVVVLSGLLVLPAFAEVTPSYYDNDVVFSDVELNDVDTGIVETEDVDTDTTNTVKKQTTGRNVGTVAGSRLAAARAGAAARGVATQRANTGRSSRNVATRSGNATPVRTTSVSTRRGGTATTTGVTQRPGTTARASVLNTTTKLYNANPVVNSRGSSATKASVTMRGAAMRAATTVAATTPSADTAADTTNELDTLKSLTEYCQAQYASCMDNYCNVLDDNQGRCSCSKNIKNYEKTEAALASATEALQDIGRDIKYIGLTSDQITTLFAETEAELTMGNAKDNSTIRSSLDKVKRMIIDVKSGTSSSTSTGNDISIDMDGLLDFDFNDSFSGFDISSFMKTSSTTGSISNQRGESLYKTATARCKSSVLNACTAQGVDAAVITNSYDLEIDKSCLAYERALTESNQQMTQTVANAKEFLKRARLAVAMNKNSYTLRECVSALESCMQDDYVCGSDYESCLDPTGQYIVNGSVVIGSMPGNNTDSSTISSTYNHDNLFSTWEDDTSHKNPWAKNPGETDYLSLSEYIQNTVKAGAAEKSSDKMPAYLQNKIGYHNDKENKDYGMCMSVLNKCQDYTYNSKTKKYIPDNEVIKQFLSRALVQIKAAQDEVLTSYAENCISDVSSCLSSNNYDSSNPTSAKSRTAINSCYSQIKTCLSVNGNVYGSVSPTVLQNWVTGNYSDVEMFESNDDIEYACNQNTTSEECIAQQGYCVANSGNSTGNITRLTSVCTYDSTITNGPKCKRNASCNNN